MLERVEELCADPVKLSRVSLKSRFRARGRSCSSLGQLELAGHLLKGASSALSNQAHVFVFADFTWNGATMILRAGVSPQIRKVAALLRLHGLHGAGVTLQEHTCATGSFLQGKSAPVMRQPREALDEVVLAQFVEPGESGDLLAGQPDLARPAAAGRATLAIMINRHNQGQLPPSTTWQTSGLVFTPSFFS